MEKIKLHIKIPKKYADRIQHIKSAIALELCDHDTHNLEKALNDSWQRETEVPICPAEETLTTQMHHALVDPIKDLKKQVFKMAGLEEFLDKHPADPEYAVLYKAIDEDEPEPITEDNYQKEFKAQYNIKLDKTIDYETAKKIHTVIEKLPTRIFKDEITIELKKLPPEKYGKYLDEENKILLDENVFSQDLFITPERKVNLGQKVLIHELAHRIDHIFMISQTDTWRKLSGWTKEKDPPETVKSRYNMNGVWHIGKWYYKNTATFISDYASRNPKEDFAESMAYYLLDQVDLFKVKNCTDKSDFIVQYALSEDMQMPELVKKTALTKALGEPRTQHKYIRREKDPKTGKWEYIHEHKKVI